MTYICIKCERLWVVGEPSAEWSGGVCDDCITEYVRSKQRNAGFKDCFRRAVEVCGKHECRYHDLCCRHLHKDYQDENPKDYFEHNSCQL